MIQYMSGDLFQSGAECLVNTVNCEGYMGKGIAYQFKLQFPENNRSYVKVCRDKTLTVGRLHVFRENGTTIINFPTKDKWREPSKMEYIENGLNELVRVLPQLDIRSVAIPPLGCGNGGLDWTEVRKLLQDKLAPIEEQFTISIYEPGNSYSQKPVKAPAMSVSSLVILELTMGLNRRTKLRLQKTAYFMNVFLKEDYFKFQKYKYGPYAHAIDIISRNIKEYQDYYGLKDTKSTYQKIYQTICSERTNQTLNKMSASIKKAADYVNRIEDNHDLEGIASVLYLIQISENASKEQVYQDIQSWSDEKAAKFSEQDVLKYMEQLEESGIIEKNILGMYQMA